MVQSFRIWITMVMNKLAGPFCTCMWHQVNEWSQVHTFMLAIASGILHAKVAYRMRHICTWHDVITANGFRQMETFPLSWTVGSLVAMVLNTMAISPKVQR